MDRKFGERARLAQQEINREQAAAGDAEHPVDALVREAVAEERQTFEEDSGTPRITLKENERKVFKTQSDSPPCPECGAVTIRNGSCYKCNNCGATTGCS
jgi:ribonucleoside-diphosphate reductase alpha chain